MLRDAIVLGRTQVATLVRLYPVATCCNSAGISEGESGASIDFRVFLWLSRVVRLFPISSVGEQLSVLRHPRVERRDLERRSLITQCNGRSTLGLLPPTCIRYRIAVQQY